MDKLEAGIKEGRSLDYYDAGLSENTRIAYSKAIKEAAGKYEIEGMTPVDVCDFVLGVSKRCGYGTVQIYVSALKHWFSARNMKSPTDDVKVRNVMKGLQRKREPVKRVRALVLDDIVKICERLGESRIEQRAKALLNIGFTAALRRSEITALDVSDFVLMTPNKATLKIRRSKTDQAGVGVSMPIINGKKLQPVTTVQEYLNACEIDSGPMFQTMKRGGHNVGNRIHHSDVSRIIKECAALIGIDKQEVAGHSLRAGMITTLARKGVSPYQIMTVSRHKSLDMLMVYIREVDPFARHPLKGVL